MTRKLRLGLLCSLLAGCSTVAPPAHETAPPRLVVHGATFETGGGTVVHAQRATIDDLGNGAGQVVHATMAPQSVPETGKGGTRPPLEITAPASDWDLRTRTVRFTGGVTALRGEVQLTCKDLEVRYADADRIDVAVATGDVVVLRGARRATGDRAVLTSSTGRLELTGSPKVDDGPNTLTGSRITLFLDDERVQCDDCRLVVAGSALGPQ